MFDSAADVRLQDMFPLYWHSEKSEYTWGWQAQDAYDRLEVGRYLLEQSLVS